MTTVAVSPPRAQPGLAARVWRFVKRHVLTVYAVLAVSYLMLPIAVVILFSFNKPAGQFNYVWEEFTFDNWVHWNAVLGIQDAIVTSLEVGLLATVVATALGTLIAMAIVRHHFVGRGATNVLIFLPMATPEIVLGASLLTLFLNTTAIFQLGFVTIFIAHVMFIVSFVVVTVKARLIGFDRHLEEAAMRSRRERGHHLPQGDAAADRARDARCGAARVRSLDRRLRDHVLQCRSDADVPDLRLGHRTCLRSAAGKRDRECNLHRCNRLGAR